MLIYCFISNAHAQTSAVALKKNHKNLKQKIMTCTCVSFVVFSCFLSVHFIGDGKWFKFNEEIVTHANFSVIKEVVNQRLAASKKQTPIIFVYIRDSELEKVLEEV